LGFEILIGHWMIDAAHSVFDELLETSAVAGCEADPDLVFLDGRILCCHDAIAQENNVLFLHSTIAELSIAAGALSNRDCGRVVDTELSFKAGLGRPVGSQLQDKWVH